MPSYHSPRISYDVCPIVFQYLLDSRITLLNLTLTCSTLRSIAQPLLFRRVTFRPYQTYVQFQHQSKTHFPFVKSNFQWQRRRLDFLASLAIAPAVRHIHILPTESWVHDVPTDLEQGDIHALLDVFLGALPAFINLREIMFSHLHFQPHQIALLSKVGRFKKVVIVGCSAPQDTPPQDRLTVDYLQITPSLDTSALNHVWLSAIHLDVLSTLYFSTNESTHTFLTSTRASCMHALRSLDIHITHSSTIHILSILSALPALEILNITNFFRAPFLGPFNLEFDLAARMRHLTLPALRHYNGPLNILLHLHLPHLHYLNIVGTADSIPAEPDILIRSLPLLKDMLSGVRQLGFGVLYMTDSLSRNLFSFLPPEAKLESLRFFVCNPRPTASLELPPGDSLQSICTAMMESDLPRNIQKVHVFFYLLNSTATPHVIDYVDIKNNLSDKYATLRCLWFQRANDVFFWCRNADGRQSMSNATNPEYGNMFDEA